jgi:hypothetical protein
MIEPTVFKFVKTVKYLNRAGFPCYIDVLIRKTETQLFSGLVSFRLNYHILQYSVLLSNNKL